MKKETLKNIQKIGYPNIILFWIYGDEYEPISKITDIEASLEYLMKAQLTDKQRAMLVMRYKHHLTYEQISEAYDITRARVEQAIHIAINKLKNAAPQSCLSKGINATLNENQHKIEALEKENRALRLQLSLNSKPEISSEEMPIEDLDLSTRPYHCLKRYSLNTVTDVLNLNPKEFVKIRNLGANSALEIIYKLEGLGFDMLDKRKTLKYLYSEAKHGQKIDFNNEV